MNTQKTLYLAGATSDMALAIGREFAGQGWNLILGGRDPQALEPIRTDLEIRHNIQAKTVFCDVAQPEKTIAELEAIHPSPQGMVCAIGYLGDQKKAEQHWSEAATILHTNFNGCVALLNAFANQLEINRNGFIIGISSVAGDRGRQSNYIYGAAKAGFTAYLSGLRSRLAKKNVHVMTVKPGFVYTRMTEAMKLPAIVTATPEQVAKDVFAAYQKGKDVIYTRWFWRWIMLIIRSIPEKLFKKLSL